jgi:hypothetical protein
MSHNPGEHAHMDHSETQRVLRAYVAGELSRGTAMEFLNLHWYGDLLVLLNRHGVARPTLSAADRRVMGRAKFDESSLILANNDKAMRED